MQQLIIKNGVVIAIHDANQAIADRYPGCECILSDADVKLFDADPRSDEEKRNNYKEKRRVAYPPVQDQLDMLYHDTVNATSTWVDAIRAIKEKFPQPEVAK